MTKQQITSADIDTLKAELAQLDDTGRYHNRLFSWINDNGSRVSIQDLEETILPLASKNGFKDLPEEVAENWMRYNSTNFEDVKNKILPACKQESRKRDILRSFITETKNSPIDMDTFVNHLLPTMPVTFGRQLALSFVEHQTTENTTIGVEDLRDKIFTLRTHSDQIDERDFGRNLNNTEKLSLAKIWMQRPENRQKKSETKLEDAKILFPENDAASQLAATWLTSEMNRDFIQWVADNLDDHRVNLDDLRAILDFSTQYTNHGTQLIRSWIGKNSNNISSQELVEKIIPLDKTQEESFAATWLESVAQATAVDLNVLLSSLRESGGIDLIDNFWKKTPRNFENLKNVSPLLTGRSSHYVNVASLTQDWETNNKTTLDLDHLKELLPLCSNEAKVDLIKYWTKTSNYSNEFSRFTPDEFSFDFNHLKELLPLVDDQVKSALVEIWAVYGRDFDFDQFKEIKTLFSDESKKDSLTKFWITRDSNKALDNFVTAAKEDLFGSRYNSENIAKSYFQYKLSESEIVPLCQKLNPNNEFLQADLFASLIKPRRGSYNYDLRSNIKSFVTSLSDDDIALDVIKNNRHSISESDILEISSNRLSTKYESIADILKNKGLEDSLSKEGLEEVKSLFAGEDPSFLENKTLADLFSYYDLKNDFIAFKSFVKEEVLQEIRETYIPTAKSPYISETEYKKLQNLINSEDHPDTNLTLVPVEVLTKYLKSKISPIPQLVAVAPLLLGEGANGEMIWQEGGAQGEMRLLPPPPPSNVAVESISIPPAPQAQSPHEEIAKYHFGKSEILRTLEESKEEDLSNLIESKDSENPASTELSQITDQFRNLLSKQKDDSSKLEVADFFKKILRLEDSIDSRTGEIVHAIKPDNQAKLYDFFFENRNELAFLFQQENGLDKFSGTIGSLGDGCVANIATQAKVALYQTLIKDNIDQILYSVFVERFSTPILNDGNSDHLGGSRTGTDPLENSHINKHSISPNGLIKVLIEEFYKNEEMVRNPFNFIINFAAEDCKNSTDSNLSESDRTLQVEKGTKDLRQILMDMSEEDAASSATSVIVGELSNRLPEEVEIFNTKYLKKFFDHISNIDLDSRQKMENLEMSSQDDRSTLRDSEAAAKKKALFDAKLAEGRRRVEATKQNAENARMSSEDKVPREAIESTSAIRVTPVIHNHNL